MNILQSAASKMTGSSSDSDLQRENAKLKKEIEKLKFRLQSERSNETQNCISKLEMLQQAQETGQWGMDEKELKNLTEHPLSVVVVGASGDLAVKKTFPALFSLYVHDLLPEKFIISGYARSDIKHDDFIKKISSRFPKEYENTKEKNEFLKQCFYVSGQYDSPDDFKKCIEQVAEKEKKSGKSPANRIFYLAIPPNVFVPTAKSISQVGKGDGWNRLIIEKPFGKDLETSGELGRDLADLFPEDQIYRIDHYLGKEMVQNLMVLRFSNKVLEPIWSSQHISNVMITFKEDFGTQGRGGYFDQYGIIRDVMQNHILQILTLIAMEPPVTLSAEDVRDEKVKVLRSIPPLKSEDLVIGQYGTDPKGRESSYLEDATVPKDSITPTFACSVLHIQNERWANCPFILKCGKALNERKTEIRIQFKKPNYNLFTDLSNNELVMRVQPDEAVYLKLTTKKPGLEGGLVHTELDLSYKQRFAGLDSTISSPKSKKQPGKLQLPDAYERLIFDVLRGDHNLFVRSDELTAAWAIFTPILHELEKQKVKPIEYKYGSRGPEEADELAKRYGFQRTENYTWKPSAQIAV